MTVGELITELEKYDKNTKVEVQFCDDDGDYYGTEKNLCLIKLGDVLIL